MAATIQRESGAAPSSFRARTLGRFNDRVLFGLIILGFVAAAWRSFSELLPLARGDTPLSFVPLVPIIGMALLVWRFDADAIRRAERDASIDLIATVLLLLASVVVLMVLPVSMSWDYWLDRLDVPGLILLLATALVVTWGVPALSRLGSVLLYMLLAWPLPLVLIDGHIIPTITASTAAVAQFFLPVLPFGILPEPGNAYGLLVPYHGQINTLVIAQACAGVNSMVGLVVLALPLACTAPAPWKSRLGWLACGALLSWLVNLLRIATVAIAVSFAGDGPTMALVHPVVGMALFGFSFLLLLVLAPRFGLHFPFLQRTPKRQAAPHAGPGIGVLRLAVLVAVLIAGVVADSAMTQFTWITETGLPRVGTASAADLVHPPPGWRPSNVQTITAWKPLFGGSTVSAVEDFIGPHHAAVTVQAILTRDAGSFQTYGVEDCYTFHGYTLRGVHKVGLGSGVTAGLVDFSEGSKAVTSLYWIVPVQTPHGLYHERIVVLADAGKTFGAIHAAAIQQTDGNPARTVGEVISSFLSPWTGGSAGAAFRAPEAEVLLLGNQMIAQERHAST